MCHEILVACAGKTSCCFVTCAEAHVNVGKKTLRRLDSCAPQDVNEIAPRWLRQALTPAFN